MPIPFCGNTSARNCAEGPLDYIRQFLDELDDYRSSLLGDPSAPGPARRAG